MDTNRNNTWTQPALPATGGTEIVCLLQQLQVKTVTESATESASIIAALAPEIRCTPLDHKPLEVSAILDIWAARSTNSNPDGFETKADTIIAPVHQLQAKPASFPLCPMPTDFCRISPFFPLGKHDLRPREYMEMATITSSWGNIIYTGPRLSTYEEDALAALLAYFDTHKHLTGNIEGRITYRYQGPLLPILRLMGIDNPNGSEYLRVVRSFELMACSVIEISTRKNTTRGKSVLKPLLGLSNIMTFARLDKEAKTIDLTLNPYFYLILGSGNYTLLNVKARNKLSSPVAKVLYRFIQSHRGDVWKGHYKTLAATLNLDLEQYPSKIKSRIAMAISKLIEYGHLSVKSGQNGDLVCLYRQKQALRSTKTDQS